MRGFITRILGIDVILLASSFKGPLNKTETILGGRFSMLHNVTDIRIFILPRINFLLFCSLVSGMYTYVEY